MTGLDSVIAGNPSAAGVAQLVEKVDSTHVTALAQLVESKGEAALPYVLPKLSFLFEAVGSKDEAVATAGKAALERIANKIPGPAIKQLLRGLEDAMGTKAKPAQKEMALQMVGVLAENNANEMRVELRFLIPIVAQLITDAKKPVAAKAEEVMTKLCKSCGNKDLEPFFPRVVEASGYIKKVPECVEALASCLFVQVVEAPALSVLLPVLTRGLKERDEAVNRRTCRIIANMCKLIDDPKEALPLFAEIHTLVAKAAENTSDPEVRAVVNQALTQLNEKKLFVLRNILGMENAQAQAIIATLVGVAQGTIKAQDAQVNTEAGIHIDLAANEQIQHLFKGFHDEVVEYLAYATTSLVEQKVNSLNPWTNLFKAFDPHNKHAKDVDKLRNLMTEKASAKPEPEFVDDEGEDLYKGVFTLAYGTHTLLRETKLLLKKKKFYGLLGENRCGKTSLMHAMSNEQIDGFPTRDQLRTVFVEHEIRECKLDKKKWNGMGSNLDLCGVDYVVHTCNELYQANPPVSRQAAEKALMDLGFGNKKKGVTKNKQGKPFAADCENPLTSYSGGWKVKMQLIAATLMKADILLLDEPTGHMDKTNIAWLKGEFLTQFHNNGGTVIATSHDAPFLNEMCTHMLWFESNKLKQFKGKNKGKTLDGFIKEHPEKKVYTEKRQTNLKFDFPPPGPLDGVKSKGRAILKMQKVSFRWPGHDQPTVKDINLSMCMASRVAVVGPNGAGKSTAIKLLIGEEKPEVGTVWRHGGSRIAYVAQQALHHLEQNLDKSPTAYIMWRFAGNQDRESMENRNQELNEDEEALRNVPWCIDVKTLTIRKCTPGEKSDVPVAPESIQGRRKNKEKKYEYEVKFVNKPIEATSWIERDTLRAMGWEKMVLNEDEKQAAAAGLMLRPLTQPGVEQHLAHFGLDSEAATHTPIKFLSGGEKAKVVIAAAMWLNPHIIILDEPTNYLDPDGLGALQGGLQDYGGGVVIISHNEEFANAICTEQWVMDAGNLARKGEIPTEDAGDVMQTEAAEEIIDPSGNIIVVEKHKNLGAKDLKKQLKEVKEQLKKNKNEMTEDFKWQLEDKQAEIEEQIKVLTGKEIK